MRFIFVLLIAVALAALIWVVPQRAQEGEDVRGAFLTSRTKEKPQNTTPGTRPNRRRPKPSATPSVGHTPEPNPSPTTSGSQDGTPKKVNQARLGLGLTLFMRDSNGLAVRVDPSHVFHRGDRVRILLETNSDGYLYIFNTTGDGPPIMIYPAPELDEAGNYLQAHIPFEIPSSLAAEERLRWLMFDENLGDEHLFFVFTKDPLSGAPIEDDLIAYCRAPNAQCPFRPSTELWEAIQKQLKEPLQSDKTTNFGLAQTRVEQQATTRGLGLAQTDPEPSLIMMASSKSSTLVTSLDLVHK